MPGLRFAAVTAILCIAAAQPTIAAAPYRAPRTPDGQPDLQGAWTNVTKTPLQRRKGVKDLITTEAELKVLDDAEDKEDAATEAAAAVAKPKSAAAVAADTPTVGESEWFAKRGMMRIDGRMRSSIIVDPADGRIPYNAIGRRAVADALRRDDNDMADPEDRHADERCLSAVSGSAVPPMLPPPYNGHYRIIQTPGYVAIASEMIHDVRLIPLAARSHGGEAKWQGDSVGRWDGDTLVVETVDQAADAADRFATGGLLHLTPAAVVTERFTRTSPTEIRYAFTVQDASVFTRPWRGELVFTATDEASYEYACHEGNYALANVLRGARKKDQDAAAAVRAVETKPAAPVSKP